MSSKDIERFATWARYELQTQIELRAAFYGIAETDTVAADAWELHGRTLTALEREQRASLVEQVQARGYAAVVEEATYTWFNRFVALRFMDVNGYLETGASWFTTPGQVGFCPEVLAQAHLLNLDGLDVAEVERYRAGDDEEGLLRYLMVLQCNALSRVLPRMFTPMEDWTQLLCPAQLLRDTGVLARMVQDIPEEDWAREVEIVGWMYQHYNSARKAEVMELARKGSKFELEDIAPATQLFTPEWIVRYMVQNSLGRLWMANHPHSRLAERMEFYIPPEEAPAGHLRVQSPEELRLCDPACGSGHVLTYAFELLTSIYEEEGYAASDIPALILAHNLYGMDLDHRAGELAYFALMMKARSRDRRFLRRGVQPHICVLEPLDFEHEELAAYLGVVGLPGSMPGLLDTLHAFAEADNFGSLIRSTLEEPGQLREQLLRQVPEGLLMQRAVHDKVLRVLEQADYLRPRYHVVVANPPYMGINKMNLRLRAWVRDHYADGKEDLFASFMLRNMELALPGGQLGFMTPFVWMFIASYEKLRERLIRAATLTSLVQLEYSAFAEATVPICTFTLENRPIPAFRGGYIRLSAFRGSEQQAPRALEAVQNPDCPWFYRADAAEFAGLIPGGPLAYWIGEKTRRVLTANASLAEVAQARCTIKTGDNKRFLRFWHEVTLPRVAFGAASVSEALETGCKWFPLNKGGEFRKWYGNLEYVLNWEKGGEELMGRARAEGRNVQDYPAELKFLPVVSWSSITSSGNAFRFYPQGMLHELTGGCAFGGNADWKLSLLAYANTSFAVQMAQVLNSTIHFQPGDFAKLPYAEKFWSAETSARAERLIELAKEDWDDRETSWDFETLPLLRPQHRRATLAETYAALRAHWQNMTEEMARLEEENNRSFNELYELGDEFPAAVPPEQITLSCNPAYRYGAGDHEDLLLADTVKELISWAVGCMFGRYSLATPGLAYAGGNWHAERYGEFPVDADNIIPICDDDYFPDDICGRFVDLVRLVFGAEALEQNLSFIAEALGGKGTARDVIRNYFLKDFYADHLKAYSKRPIYWQFDSGKKGGFRALVYLHRYTADTLALMRTDYVFRQQERYRAAMADLAQRAEEATGRERVALSARLKKISEQEAETAAFEQALHHLANARISLDLDAGVVANYARFSPILTKIR